MSKFVASFQPPVFVGYRPPAGFILDNPACHALMYYALLARKAYEEERDGLVQDAEGRSHLIMEGELDPQYNYRQLFSSVATMYGVQPEQMLPFWSAVDLQFQALGLPKLPDAEKYRFNRTPEIKTQ